MSGEKVFWVRSMYGHKHRQPAVVFTMPGGETVQMSPAEARELAGNVLACAEAAEGDAFTFEFLREKTGISEESAAQVLHDFRGWRDAHRPAEEAST